MKLKQGCVATVMMTIGLVFSAFPDVIVTIDGDELSGKIIEVTNDVVRYIPHDTSTANPRSIPRQSVFMLKYDDGRKEVIGGKKNGDVLRTESDNRLYSAYIFCETGLFGLININEEDFDPGIFTIGVTPGIDRRINRYFSIGVEYMILWARPNPEKATDSRFLMNCNALSRATFPLHPKINFLAQLSAGLSIWPGAESVHSIDTTFFMDRIGWDIHGGLGLEYKALPWGSLVLFAGYNANFSTLHEIPVTIDMLMVSVGPKIKF